MKLITSHIKNTFHDSLIIIILSIYFLGEAGVEGEVSIIYISIFNFNFYRMYH